MSVADYNTDPDSNTSISGINIAEGCPPSGINNAIRQMMADVKSADDANAKISGAQAVAGAKTFSDTIIESNDTASMKRPNTTGALRMTGGTNTSDTGALLSLFGADNNNQPGYFRMYAVKDANTATLLEGRPDGTLSWGGKGFVYDSGNQTVGGEKTFSADVPIKLSATEANIRKDVPGQPSSQRSIYFGIYDTQSDGYETYSQQWWNSTNTSNQHGIKNMYSGNYHYYALRSHSSAIVNLEPVNSSIWLGRNSSGYKWEGIYLNAAAINTSDERLKDNIEPIPDAVLDAWGDVRWTQFQFKESIVEKGADKARLHTGAIAQRIAAAFAEHGIDAGRYGLWCHDHWDAEQEEVDSRGNVVTPAHDAEDAYALRYEEALCMEAAYQRRRADRAEARITELERRLDEMEAVLASIGGQAE